MSQEQVISASLLKNIVVGPVSPRFNIGMDNWIDYDLHLDSAHSNSQENRKLSTVNDSSPQLCKIKKPALALANEPALPPETFRFAKATKEEMIDKYAKQYVPKKNHSLVSQNF